MAGFPCDYREDRLGVIDLDVVRWNNIRGVSSAPPKAVIDRVSGKTINLTGHRGTSNRHILQAIEVLSQGLIRLADIPHRLLSLTHLPDVMNQMLSPETRSGTKWVKAIVNFSPENRGNPILTS